MWFTWKNTAATVLVAAIVVPYAGYLVWTGMPFIEDPREMAATGLVLGIAAAALAVRRWFAPGAVQRVALLTGTAALGLGVAALWTKNDVVLATFMAAIVVTWALAEFHHMHEVPATRRQAGPTAAGRHA